jgi:hypothetical protein
MAFSEAGYKGSRLSSMCFLSFNSSRFKYTFDFLFRWVGGI